MHVVSTCIVFDSAAQIEQCMQTRTSLQIKLLTADSSLVGYRMHCDGMKILNLKIVQFSPLISLNKIKIQTGRNLTFIIKLCEKTRYTV